MRESIRSVTPTFNTHRMVKEYAERLYLPAAKAHMEFSGDNYRAAAELSQWKARMRQEWPQVRITEVQIANPDRQSIQVGNALRLTAAVHLGAVDPQHVRVEAYHGEAENDTLRNATASVLTERDRLGDDGDYLYEGSIPATESGAYGFSVRVVPTYPYLLQAHELRLIAWS